MEKAMLKIARRYRIGGKAVVLGLLTLVRCSETNSLETGISTPAKENVNILKFANTGLSLAKKATLSKMIVAEVGGSLSFLFPDGGPGEDAMLAVTLTVPPGSLSQDTEISLSFDGESLDFEFQPDGTYFSQPARLDVDANGVSLAGVNFQNISLFYNNKEQRNWEPMRMDSVIITENAGRLQLTNARIPHFSRYVLAEE